jgi:hypothetical protein
MAEDLVILVRVFDLLEWLVPKGEAFPRAFRHTVTARLLGAALDLPERLFEAQSRRGRQRREALAEADATLNKLRLYVRLAHRWRWLVRWPVRVREPHGRGGRALARRLDKADRP